MNNINNILLDLDGTLTDPKEGITKSIQYALEQLDIQPPHEDDLEWTIGPPLIDVFKELLRTTDKEKLLQAVDFYRQRYEDRCAVENKPYEGIHNTLSSLQEKGFRLYLATSKPWTYAGKILAYFGMRGYFSRVHGSELDGTRDYKEELIEYIIAENKLESENTIMVGDRHYDINGAKHNKVISIGVTYGYGSIEEINTAAPDHICHHHSDIVKIIT